MKVLARPQRNVNVGKAAIYAIVINGMQIALIVAIFLIELLLPGTQWNMMLVRTVVGIAGLVVIWGAVVDIREALSTRRLVGQLEDMDLTIDAMENLNNTLRSQRHDFLNHLQVVYSLMEMEDYEEAGAYIQKVYGRITAVSRVMKTANPAVNALLQVKVAACEKEGIRVNLNIQSAWKDLPVPGWEMCKVLSNLIDNAIDALQEVSHSERGLTLTLTEDLQAFRFSVSNTGPMIPVSSRQSIFQPGITTKSAGHGMGLYIVKKTLEERGGGIELTSDAEETTFSGWVPKRVVPVAELPGKE
ncbi:MAG: Spo0B domain-containing protein [Christensenellaceae bacterium]|nr:Spo0B domain-containing protein [Christensenellaceae bacterium]